MYSNFPALALAALAALASAPAQDAEPRPDPALQAGLRRVLAAADEEEQRAALAALAEAAGPAHGRLVPQLFLFLDAAHDTREAMLAGFVLDRLQVPAADVVAALVPLLESDSPARRQALARVLSGYEPTSVDRGTDFSVYAPFLGGEPPPGLVRHLYAVDPDAALLVLTRAQVREVEELRALLWDGHELADLRWKRLFGYLERAALPGAAPEAVAALERLARSPRWWARCAAAVIASEEPALATAAHLATLRGDPHPLVHELAAAGRAR